MSYHDLTNPNAELCKGCQWCCKHLIIPVAYRDDEFLTARGHDCIHSEWKDEVLIKVDCQHITEDGCAIYEDRPLACHVFPQDTHPMVWDHCEVMRKLFADDSC